MEELPPRGLASRRRFLKLSASSIPTLSLSALWLQGCASVRSSTSTSGARRSDPNLPSVDHPLASLSFPRESIVSSKMDIRSVLTPVHVAEGNTSWHQKGQFPYLYRVTSDKDDLTWEDARGALHTPPVGIRSGIAMGGFGAGSIELRADGRLVDWQIFNNSPADGSKTNVEEAFLAIRTQRGNASPQAITLRTNPPASLPAVETMGFAGAYPVTRLRPMDDRIPLRTALFAYTPFRGQDLALTQTPAIVFSFLLSNPTNDPVETSVLFNMPNHLGGTFRTERGLILSREGDEAEAGEICMEFASNLDVSSMVATDLEEIWETFEDEGVFEDSPSLGIFEYGAIASRFVIEPGASRTVSIVLSWRFPNRTIAGSATGNAYATTYATASDASAEVTRHLPQIWASLRTWDALFAGSSLPAPIQQAWQGSLSQLQKTAFCTADQRWRFWDSFSDGQISSVDATLFSALPLLLFAPDTLQSLLRAYAVSQLADGRISRSLGEGKRHPLDKPVGQRSNRPNPAFFILTYAYYAYSGDEAYLKELWPHLKKAFDWQLLLTTPEGLPAHEPAGTDWTATREGTFALTDASIHLAGLSAFMRMAEVLEMEDDVKLVRPVLSAGVKSFYANLETNYVRLSRTKAVSLIGLAWAGILGLDEVLESTQLQALINHISTDNAPPISLKISKAGQNVDAIYPSTTMVWTALRFIAGADNPRAMAALSDLFEHQEAKLSDPWGHYERLSLPDGLPHSNPNHASHLAIWFVVLALSGQQFDAKNRSLFFSPRLSSGARLPFFIPEARGFISVQRSGRFLIEIVSGRLELKTLTVGSNIVYRDILLEEGQALQLNP